MPQTRECDYCGSDIEPGTGTMFVRTDGTVIHYCSSKCEANADLGREARDLEWTGPGREADERAAAAREREREADEAAEAAAEETGDAEAAEATQDAEEAEDVEEEPEESEAETADEAEDAEEADETDEEEAEA